MNPSSSTPPTAPLMPRLPLGFRFRPDKRALVSNYLYNKVHGYPLPCDGPIKNVDVYAHNPEQLPIDSESMDEIWAYFFTQIKPSFAHGQSSYRRTPNGYWKEIDGEKPIIAGNRLLGSRKKFVFYRGRTPRGNRTRWFMKEYRLPEMNPLGTVVPNCVACKVYSKKPN